MCRMCHHLHASWVLREIREGLVTSVTIIMSGVRGSAVRSSCLLLLRLAPKRVAAEAGDSR
jgi:hypothetical protein